MRRMTRRGERRQLRHPDGERVFTICQPERHKRVLTGAAAAVARIAMCFGGYVAVTLRPGNKSAETRPYVARVAL